MEDQKSTQEQTSDLVAWWVDGMKPRGFDYGTMIACITAKLLDSEHAPAFRKNIDQWTKVLTTDGDCIKDLDSAGYNREMQLLLALSQG